MRRRVDPWSVESAGDVLEYLAFAGHPTTRDQLGRLYRRQLVAPPVVGPGDHPGAGAYFPSGTAERALRAIELRGATKHADDVAWRLWWEGHDVDLETVRGYLVKRAGRWDEQVRDLHPAGTEPEGPEATGAERDVVEEVFFRHLRANQTQVAARRRIVRGSEFYVDFVAFVTDLVSAPAPPGARRAGGLFAPPAALRDRDLRAGARVALVMRRDLDLSYVELAASLHDEELVRVRDVAARYLAMVARLGEVIHDAYGGAPRGRDVVGGQLVAWAEGPDEQVLAVLLTSSLVHDARSADLLPAPGAVRPPLPAVSFRDFVRLRHLAASVPGLVALSDPSRAREAFASGEGLAKWRAEVDEVRYLFSEEVVWAMGECPELFDLEPPGPEETRDEADQGSTPKKKIQNRSGR